MVNDGQTYLINGINEIGKFMLHYGSKQDNPDRGCLRQCLKCEIENKAIKLVPGYKDYQHNFYTCPVASFYVQLNEMSFAVIDQKETVIVDVVVFSKDFLKNRKLEIRYPSRTQHDLMGVNGYINMLNYYVADGNDVDQLDGDLFLTRLNFEPLEQDHLAKLINGLTIKFYENSSSRVGKDNEFWDEAIITNMPDSKYITELIVLTISKTRLYKYGDAEVRREQDCIIIEHNHTKAYSPHHGRQPLTDDNTEANRIKDLIKMNFRQFFNERQEINERFKRITV